MSLSDVLVVGAGPAGSIAALVLARAGVRVHLVDRATFPRTKLCGDTLNPGALALLNRLGLAGEVLASAVPLDGMTVTGPGGAKVTALYGPQIRGAALPRYDLDLLLLRAAVAAGVEFQEGMNVLGALGHGDGNGERARVTGAAAVTPGGRKEKLFAPITIAADGRRSRIAIGLGLARHPAWPRRWAIGSYYEGLRGVGRVGEMHVRPSHYLGIAPLPAGLANVCLVVPLDVARAGRHPAALLEAAIDGDPTLRDRFRGARRLVSPSVLGPLAVDAVGRSVPGLLVAGDAAGFIDPMTGDGMHFALRGGELAAAEAIRLLDEGPRAVEGCLRRRLDREFRRKRAFNRALRRLVGSTAAVSGVTAAGALLPGLVAAVIRYAGDVGTTGGVSRSTIPPAAAPGA